MKWFKHITDSLEDPFIFELMRKFGGDGYLTFFGILEIYSREFQVEVGWKLTVTRDYLKMKLCKRQATLIIKSLEFIKNSGKWEIEFSGEQITIFIPKFRELLDETTIKKLRQKEELFRNRSGNLPKKDAIDIDIDIDIDKDIDKEKDKEKEKELKDIVDSPPECPHQSIIALYHELIPELSRVVKWTPKRSQHLQACWRDKDRQSLDWWRDYFMKVRGSPFLIGDNPRGWKVDLEWLTTESNLVKVLEGKYNGNGTGRTGSGTGATFKEKGRVGCSGKSDGNPWPVDLEVYE